MLLIHAMATRKPGLKQLEAYIKKHKMKQADFGRRVGVTQGMVWQWIHGKRAVGPVRAHRIVAATNGEITLHDLRPDVFPRQRQAA